MQCGGLSDMNKNKENPFKVKGYLCKTKDNVFYISVSFYVSNKRHRKNFYLSPSIKHNEANKLINQYEQQVMETLQSQQSRITSGSLIYEINFYKEHLNNIRQNTREKYETILDKFIEQLEIEEQTRQCTVYLQDFTTPHLFNYLQHLADKDYKLDTIRSHGSCILKAVNDRRAVLGLSPILKPNYSNLSVKSTKQQIKRIYFTDEEIKQIVDFTASNKKYNCLTPVIKTLIVYGLRRAEILALRWSEVDFDDNVFYITRTRVRSSQGIIDDEQVKTPTSLRSFPINDIILTEYNKQKQLGVWTPDGYVFLNNQNKPHNPDYVSKLLKQVIRELGLPDNLSFKSTRSTCATYLISSNISDSNIEKWLGHYDIETTKRYYAQQTMSEKNNILNDIKSHVSLN